MTRQFAIIIMYFLFHTSYGQWDIPTIIFNDGTELEGWHFNFLKNEIQFQKDKESKLIKYPYDSIKQLRVMYDKKNLLIYESVKIEKSKHKQMLELLVNGCISLYKTNNYSPSNLFGDVGLNSKGYLDGGDIPIVFYFRRENEDTVTKINTGYPIPIKFRKNILKYFGDCSSLVLQIKNRKLKSKKPIEVINFYNSNCID